MSVAGVDRQRILRRVRGRSVRQLRDRRPDHHRSGRAVGHGDPDHERQLRVAGTRDRVERYGLRSGVDGHARRERRDPLREPDGERRDRDRSDDHLRNR